MRRSSGKRESCSGLDRAAESQNPLPFAPLRAGSVARNATRVGHPEEKDGDGYYLVDRSDCARRRDLALGRQDGTTEGRWDYTHHQHAGRVRRYGTGEETRYRGTGESDG